MSPPPPRQKETITRNQNACDACRSRKTKCISDSGNERCQGCIFLDIHCTRRQPRRRRGPPNRLAATAAVSQVQGPRLVTSVSMSIGSERETQSRPSGLGHPIASASPQAKILPHGWLSSFVPKPVLNQILHEWFDKVHPLAPILLRSRFLRRLRNGDADTNKSFCGLVISVCAATTATLPRRDYGPVTTQACLDFIERNGLVTGGLAHSGYTLEWCTAMYNMGTALGAIVDSGLSNKRCYHMLSEATAGVRYLAYYCMHQLDHAEQQLLKRLFLLLFAGSCADMLGRLSISISAQDAVDSFPKPLPVSDRQMDPSLALEANEPKWHGDDTSYVPGLVCLSSLFSIWQEARSSPVSSDAKVCLNTYLSKVQEVVDNFPPQLRWRGGLSRPSNVTEQHDVQIANLFITSLHLKSNLFQKFGGTGGSPLEHQKIVDDLLEILYHLPRAVFDANGSSIVPKIRDIGAAYLEQVHITDGADAMTSSCVRVKLEQLLRKLDDLDCWQGRCIVDNPQSSLFGQ